MTAASTDGRADGVCEASNSEIFKSFEFSLMFDTLPIVHLWYPLNQTC